MDRWIDRERRRIKQINGARQISKGASRGSLKEMESGASKDEHGLCVREAELSLGDRAGIRPTQKVRKTSRKGNQLGSWRRTPLTRKDQKKTANGVQTLYAIIEEGRGKIRGRKRSGVERWIETTK